MMPPKRFFRPSEAKPQGLLEQLATTANLDALRQGLHQYDQDHSGVVSAVQLCMVLGTVEAKEASDPAALAEFVTCLGSADGESPHCRRRRRRRERRPGSSPLTHGAAHVGQAKCSNTSRFCRTLTRGRTRKLRRWLRRTTWGQRRGWRMRSRVRMMSGTRRTATTAKMILRANRPGQMMSFTSTLR